MSRYDDGMSDEMREIIKRSVAEAPPLNEHQKFVIRAAFADTDWSRVGKGKDKDKDDDDRA